MLRPTVKDAEAGSAPRLASADQGLHWIGSSTQVYPIFDLKPDRQDLHRCLRDIEEALIGVEADFS
jgi:hypothetical protein